MKRAPEVDWLLLIHQLPPSPAYLRVKVSRKLAAISALSLKNTVYGLPSNEATLEDFHWLRREILDGGGEATIVECSFVEGMTQSEVVGKFNEARSEAYAEIEREARVQLKAAGAGSAELPRLRKMLAEAIALDYLGAAGKDAAQDRLDELEAALTQAQPPEPQPVASLDTANFQARTWVTRTGVFVDRIASAWLIRRCIDADAHFRFVASRNPRLEAGELGFDMFEAKFTHEGDLCTFEVLLRRFDICERPLQRIAEIIHDLDIKDAKHNRAETPGAAALFNGIAARYRKDEDRLRAGFELLDSLREGFGRSK